LLNYNMMWMTALW